MSRILIETVADNLREGYRVQVRCWQCSRIQDVDLSELVARGLGTVSFARIADAFRCRRCGERGQIIRTPRDRAYQ